jgi:flagellar hook-length control protein FliK
MMSAKTVSTEAPACPAPGAPNTAASATAGGPAPADFQSLLAGAVAPVTVPTAAESAPTQLPLVQLLNLKQQPPKAVPAAAVTPVVKTADASADLIKLLTDIATLLPAAPTTAAEGAVTAMAEVPAEPCATDDSTPSDDEIFVDWVGTMLPTNVFATQAGSPSDGAIQTSIDGAAGGTGGESAKNAAGAVNLLPPSLVLQAGVPDDDGDAGNVAAPGAPAFLTREAGTAASVPNPLAAIAAVLTKDETTDSDKPASDGWMSALSDVAARRGPDVASAADARLSTPVHDSRWADALAHRLVLMAREGESVASLKLVPVDLGPLDIQISVRDGQASVHFGAAHPETRAVLEASMPRLRDLLSAQGLQLSNASVSHQSGGQNRPERSNGPAAVGSVTEESEVTSAKVISTSLLDTYA